MVAGRIEETKTEPSQHALPLDPDLAAALLDWRRQAPYASDSDFVFAGDSGKPRWQGIILKDYIKPAAVKTEIGKVGWHTFRHTVGTMLAEMGEHQLTIRDYLRHSNLHVTNKYLQATSKTKRSAQEKLVEAIMPAAGFRPKSTLVQ